MSDLMDQIKAAPIAVYGSGTPFVSIEMNDDRIDGGIGHARCRDGDAVSCRPIAIAELVIVSAGFGKSR